MKCIQISFALQVVGRFVVGFGVSLSAIAECIYISEIAPAVSKFSLRNFHRI